MTEHNPLTEYLEKEASTMSEKQWHDGARFFVSLRESQVPDEDRYTAIVKEASLKWLAGAARQAGKDAGSSGKKIKDILGKPSLGERIGEKFHDIKGGIGDVRMKIRDAERKHIYSRIPFVGPSRETKLRWLAERHDTDFATRKGVEAMLGGISNAKAAKGHKALGDARRVMRGKGLTGKLNRLDRSGLLPGGKSVEDTVKGQYKSFKAGRAGKMDAARKKRILRGAAVGGGALAGGATLGALLKGKKKSSDQENWS